MNFQEILRKNAWALFGSLTLVLFFAGLSVFSGNALASDLGLTEADCRCCHGATLADRHHLLVNTNGLECLSCHAMNLNQATLQLEPVVVRDCIQCHTGSLADRHHVLVDQVTYTCFNCHTMVYDPVSMSYSPDFNVSCQTPPPAIPLGQVTGSVSDAGGAPLAWTRVATGDGVYSTLTTEAGSYALPEIPVGTHTLVATLDGFVGASRTVTVGDGQTATANFVLNPQVAPGTITGVARDAKLNPLQGVKIATPDGILSASTGVNGTFALVDVAPGSYLLTAVKSGYAPASQTVTVAKGQTLTANFTLPNLPVEICGDNLDNDANGLTDCADSACSGTAACLSAVEICDDGRDNDGNSLIDCADPACMSSGRCELPAVEVCGDGLDNNGDGLLDCADPACRNTDSCLSEICDDGIDNNADGLADCLDPVCAGTSNCLPPPVEICDDGLDNDGDGLFDCDDAKCVGHPSCFQPVAEELCTNGVDDNGDGLVDCADSQCLQRSACLEEICGNGLDDDLDGQSDCADSTCAATSACTGGSGQAINYTALASDAEYSYGAAKAVDGDTNTRWWVDEDEDEWLRVDLQGIYRVDQVTIDWHTEYAEDYQLKVSKDGRYWTTVKEVSGGDGGLDTLGFTPTDARFVLVDCEDARASGFSIRELQVRRQLPTLPLTELCDDAIDNDGDRLVDCSDPDCGGNNACSGGAGTVTVKNLALKRSVKASRHAYRYEPAKAVDGSASSRWWANDDEDEWLRVDLGSVVKIGRVVLRWHSEYAENYQIRISRDGYDWTRVMEIDHGDGGVDTITFTPRDARYVLIDCEDARFSGFSFYEIEVYQQ